MPATTKRSPMVADVDESAAEPASVGGEDISSFIDETSLQSQIDNASKRNRVETRPFRQYQKRVIEKAGVRNTHQIRQLTSDVCGAVARLSDMPDTEIKIPDATGHETTEYELQVRAIAEQACSNIQSEQVLIVTAMKLARAALELRSQDPDGTKKIAWVNDTREDEAGVLDD